MQRFQLSCKLNVKNIMKNMEFSVVIFAPVISKVELIHALAILVDHLFATKAWFDWLIDIRWVRSKVNASYQSGRSLDWDTYHGFGVSRVKSPK